VILRLNGNTFNYLSAYYLSPLWNIYQFLGGLLGIILAIIFFKIFKKID